MTYYTPEKIGWLALRWRNRMIDEEEIKRRIDHIEKVCKLLKVGDMIKHKRCCDVIDEHSFTGWDGAWICAVLVPVDLECESVTVNDISPLNVVEINGQPV